MKRVIMAFLLVIISNIFPIFANADVVITDEELLLTAIKSVPGVIDVQLATEDNYSSYLLHDENGCSTIIFFSYDKVDQTQFEEAEDIVGIGTDAGGCIEIFYNIEDAEERSGDLGTLAFLAGDHVRIDNMIIRTSTKLSKAKSKQLVSNIEAALVSSAIIPKEHNKEKGYSTPLLICLIFVTYVFFRFISKLLPKSTSNKQKRAIRQSYKQSYYDLSYVDSMCGHEFENWCVELLKHNGFTRIQLTAGSGDQGVDIIAWKDGEKYAIQCKRYNRPVGNTAIQEVNTGRVIYGCSKAVVITNQTFTSGAITAANAVDVILWDRNTIARMLRQ